MGWEYAPTAYPTEFLSLSGKLGAQVRATVHSFGPLLLGKVLDLNETQTSILALVFKYCDDNDLPLLDLADLQTTLKFLSSDEGKPILKDYGGMSSASVGVLLRSIIVLEQEGADIFFGEPEFDVMDLIRTTPDGKGVVSLLELSDVMDQPRLFSTFMLWMLAQLYESLPEAGDLPKPKLCFFFDEAHLLFDDAIGRAHGPGGADRTPHPIEGCRRLLRDPVAEGRPAGRPLAARQSDPACAAGVHGRGRGCPAQGRPHLPDHGVLRHREDDHVTRDRGGAGHGALAEGRPDARRGDPPRSPDIAHGAPRSRPVPRAHRHERHDRALRRSDRPRECPRDHLGATHGGACGGRGGGRRLHRGPRGADGGAVATTPAGTVLTPAQQKREIARQARELEAARKTAERERKAAAKRKRDDDRARQRSIDNVVRQGGRVVTSKIGQDLIRGVFGTLFGGGKSK